MATNKTFNGTSYALPDNREPPGWGTALSSFLKDVADNALSKSGGNFTLTAEINFGATYGIKTAYVESQDASPASTGAIRLGNAEVVSWRNNADAADIDLTVTSSDILTFGGVKVPTISSTDTLTNKSLSDSTTAIVDEGDATKTLDFQLSGATTSTTTTIAASQTTARTITLPDATDTLVGKATTDTLTNKTLSDSTTVIGDDGDVSKALKFQLSGATTSTATTIAASQTTDRTLTLPDATDTLVGRATTDTLTNKTLTDASTAFADDGDSTKQLVVSLGGATTSTTTTLTASQTGNRAVTLPDATTTLVGTDTTDTLTNKTLTSPTLTTPVLNTSVSGTAVLDEDNMASDSATQLATQQSIKAYVDTQVASVSASGALYETKTADYTVTDVDNVRSLGVATSSVNITITLPTAADNEDRILTIHKTDANAFTVIVDGEGSETIDGQTTITLTEQYDGITIMCDGSNWNIIDHDLKATSTEPGLVEYFQTTTKALDNDFTSGSVIITRINKTVTITGTGIFGHSSASTASTSSSFIPSWALPDAETSNMWDAEAARVYLVSALTSGVIRTTYFDWAGSGSNATGRAPFSITYNIS